MTLEENNILYSCYWFIPILYLLLLFLLYPREFRWEITKAMTRRLSESTVLLNTVFIMFMLP